MDIGFSVLAGQEAWSDECRKGSGSHCGVSTLAEFGLSMVGNPTLREKTAQFAPLENIAALNLARRMIAQSCWLFLQLA
jgi:hypothetical protein